MFTGLNAPALSLAGHFVQLCYCQWFLKAGQMVKGGQRLIALKEQKGERKKKHDVVFMRVPLSL